MSQDFGPFQPVVDAIQHIGDSAGRAIDTVAHPVQSAIDTVEHFVHEIPLPSGHGYIDQKYGKGNTSPISGSVPKVGK